MKCPHCGNDMRLLKAIEYVGLHYDCLPCGITFPESLRDRITIAPLPKPEPWRPRTMEEIVIEWRDPSRALDYDWLIQQRTDDIARMLEEEAESVGGERNAPPFGYGAGCLRRMAKRIRELE